MSKKLRINFVTPGISRDVFSGGIYCILKYADGLARKGHQVNVIPYPKSYQPQWIDCKANIIVLPKPRKTLIERIYNKMDNNLSEIERYYNKKTKLMRFYQENTPEADATIATRWDTAEIVQLFGKGNKFYLMQHFEPVFYEDETSIENKLATTSYYYPLIKIANSTWLYNKIEKLLRLKSTEGHLYKCINAVDTEIYKNKRNRDMDKDHITIISYGSTISWKGFMEMAKAVSIARKRLQTVDIKWNVYGNPALPPENDIAEYNFLGFLQAKQLVEAYNDADILLSASWYESFPLFAIEGMACGLAVITTQQGTEDYAIHGETAEIVKEKDPESIANGLIKVIKDFEYSKMISRNGFNIAQKFNWERSVNNFESILMNNI